MSRGDEHATEPARHTAPTATAVLSTGSVTSLLVGGAVPLDSPLAWPLVVLVLGTIAHDIAVRALRRRQPVAGAPVISDATTRDGKLEGAQCD